MAEKVQRVRGTCRQVRRHENARNEVVHERSDEIEGKEQAGILPALHDPVGDCFLEQTELNSAEVA